MGNQPIWKAVVVAPWAAPMVLSLGAAWQLFSVGGADDLAGLPLVAFFFFLFGVPISYGAMLVLGLPYLLWLRSRGWLSWLTVCMGSIAIGCITWVGYWHFSLRPPPILESVAIGAGVGLAVGVAFSLVAGLTMRSSGPARSKLLAR